MSSIASALFDIRGLDLLATQDSPIHRRDPRAKVLTALLFVVTVVSFDKYDLSGPIPLLFYPMALAAIGNIPPRPLLTKLLAASPFALAVGLFNPLLDRTILAQIGPVPISGGWISYASILLRFCLTVSAALILVSTSGFDSICLALARMKTPRILVLQFMFLYRYILVLGDEAARTFAAWSLRCPQRKRIPPKVFVSLAGALLIRALDRAQRIHMAMLSRGFDGEIRMTHPLRFQATDLFFVLGWTAFFLLARSCNLPQLLGNTVLDTIR